MAFEVNRLITIFVCCNFGSKYLTSYYFWTMSSLTWLRDKYKAFAQKVVEIGQAHNEISSKYNELKSTTNLMKNENTRLSKILKVTEATLSVREAELKRVEQRAEYYEDKYSSIEIFTTIKVHADMLKEFSRG